VTSGIFAAVIDDLFYRGHDCRRQMVMPINWCLSKEYNVHKTKLNEGEIRDACDKIIKMLDVGIASKTVK
jgi:hypothetical protein